MNKPIVTFATLVLICFSSALFAAGVPVGSSALIGTLDYSDTFTVGTVARPDGLYNTNAGGGYNVESIYGNPAATWTPLSNFSFNTPGSACCGYPGNTGGAGVTTGLAQSGGGDFNFGYGLRNNYIVQVDAAILTASDRLDITSNSVVGGTIGAANSLSVFFRNTTVGSGIGLYNGAIETNVQPAGVVSDTNWHNFAVNFDQAANRLRIYVDQVLLHDLNLATFAGGAYANYSNAAVGAGSSGGGAGAVYWFDNFQVGAPVPEPSSAALAAIGLFGLFASRRRKRVTA